MGETIISCGKWEKEQGYDPILYDTVQEWAKGEVRKIEMLGETILRTFSNKPETTTNQIINALRGKQGTK